MLARAAALVVALLASPASAQWLVTSEEHGILRVRPDGSIEEILSRTPAVVGRSRDASHVVFVVARTNELRELDLTTRAERTITTLPGDVGLGCGGVFGTRSAGAMPEPYVVIDHVQFAESFATDGARACFEVMDRNLNMASVIAQLEVDLRSGSVTSAITLSEHCGSLDDTAIDALACSRLIRDRAADARRSGRARADAWSVREHEDRGWLVGPRGERRSIALREPAIELVSPSGRWAVLGANREEGDYIHRDLYLLALRTGHLHPIAGPGDVETDRPPAHSAWPLPIAARDLRDATRLAALGHSVAGETAVRWVGETLVLGERLLVTPGRGSVWLPGPLIR